MKERIEVPVGPIEAVLNHMTNYAPAAYKAALASINAWLAAEKVQNNERQRLVAVIDNALLEIESVAERLERRYPGSYARELDSARLSIAQAARDLAKLP